MVTESRQNFIIQLYDYKLEKNGDLILYTDILRYESAHNLDIFRLKIKMVFKGK